MSTSQDNTTVKVAIRVRPLLEREKNKRCKECLYVLPNKNQLVVGKDQNFTFDYVFNDATEQSVVYEDTVKPLVQACLDGYNATVFAYGQTGMLSTHCPCAQDLLKESQLFNTSMELFDFTVTLNFVSR